MQSGLDVITRTTLEELVKTVSRTAERLARKAEKLKREFDTKELREQADIWMSKMDSITYIRTADGVAETTEDLNAALKGYAKVEVAYDWVLAAISVGEERAARKLAEARQANNNVPALQGRVDNAGSLTPAERNDLRWSINRTISKLHKSVEFCYELGLMDETHQIEHVIHRYRMLANDLKHGRPAGL